MTEAIPAYALYGDGDPASVPSGVHAETIRARSSALGWRIGAHRHGALYQGIWIASGHAQASVEGVEADLPAGSFAFLPPLVVHAYAFAPETVGIVVSVPSSVLAMGLAAAPGARGALARPILLPAAGICRPDALAEAQFLFETILADHAGFALGRDATLNARALLIALWFAREAQEVAGAGEDQAPRRDLAVVGRFLSEVEAHFLEPRPIAVYARSVGVSVPHLGRLCRAATGRPPLGLVHDRRLIEAKRLLVYTGAPVGEIARRLGFDSPAYFSRFFRDRTGRSPLAFRQAANEAPTKAPNGAPRQDGSESRNEVGGG
ncbi:MAG: helix-turn-helix domain-containing protein [Rhizobiaceae bacterium]|nr:helix-turn-helix domain-containing protein [Rhizobiaceae bacterium]